MCVLVLLYTFIIQLNFLTVYRTNMFMPNI